MSVLMAQAKLKADRITEVRAASQKLFGALVSMDAGGWPSRRRFAG